MRVLSVTVVLGVLFAASSTAAQDAVPSPPTLEEAGLAEPELVVPEAPSGPALDPLAPARRALLEGDAAGALAILEHAAELDPQRPAVWLGILSCLGALDRLEHGLLAAGWLEHLEPGHIEVPITRAVAAARRGDRRGRSRELERVTRARPEWSVGLLARRAAPHGVDPGLVLSLSETQATTFAEERDRIDRQRDLGMLFGGLAAVCGVVGVMLVVGAADALCFGCSDAGPRGLLLAAGGAGSAMLSLVSAAIAVLVDTHGWRDRWVRSIGSAPRAPAVSALAVSF